MPTRKVNPALMQPYKLSAELSAVTGPGPLPRGQVTKKIWEYIKAKGLQDQKNKRMINTDEKLKALFGGKSQIIMFEMGKFLNAHLTKM
ncbi:MAG: hypothetical protein A2821_00195 [Candidatus Magasanikbacteria bacterium RIFCSPHIGHO2_01_FULL_41_23]|uniref:DM2 domain-containing protein n=1 Tax=Candidatus Magasanikbacteria bacterium RIFCSPLOWO2_01_FULL_40_15 TaxID=1798686 RepID=A0A1F6N4I8_9BACT|nr:MAG: hypothetical protein A2821_00195 [Candidatus Magasanikbacteria bacterium RIFCSPHIGHO2_01_FULL_41_23]OGH76585.1 MAG: hypothetical protein A3F22_04575 [Candidatus Magasanikbacteria bacterium RIFCSPHIGHO2_12_FULL_41_16]OGH78563.1 MAG: hypothetical protein A2983_02775 [Candidatus Magasanikbacteria bacterium RIFCSPLOWO2_01_FULL_40_15]